MELQIPLAGKPTEPVKLLIPADDKCKGWKGLAKGLSNIPDKRPSRNRVEKVGEARRNWVEVESSGRNTLAKGSAVKFVL